MANQSEAKSEAKRIQNALQRLGLKIEVPEEIKGHATVGDYIQEAGGMSYVRGVAAEQIALLREAQANIKAAIAVCTDPEVKAGFSKTLVEYSKDIAYLAKQIAMASSGERTKTKGKAKSKSFTPGAIVALEQPSSQPPAATSENA